eukprot:comp40448_c0_seq1/m.47420 comp40448_c0_seq1/g.47420  ORF comp40448_c0_seq1/g.47420 comp40448_c0_seq1/m.47420 type:complete len:304 (-) comp40448_c0_seq1:102-1013(-)
MAPTAAGKKKGERERPTRQWVVFCDDKAFNSPSGNASIFSLPHPKTGVLCRFMLSQNGEELLEFKKHHPNEPSSWFVGESVQKDGSIFMATTADPLFVVLPLLSKPANKKVFMTVDNLLASSDCHAFNRLSSCKGLENLKSICDVKEAGTIVAYRLNEEKMMEWLLRKVECVSDALSQSSIHVGEGAQSVLLVRSSKPEGSGPTAGHRAYAVGLLGEYLSDHYADLLAEAAGVVKEMPESTEPIKENIPNGGVKRVSDAPTDDYSKTSKAGDKNKKPKLTAAQKSLSKVDTSGMKSLASFFKK